MDRPEAVPRLERLLSVSTIDPPQGFKLPQTIQLEPKDWPVLLAAINREAHYLLAGDAEADRGRPGAETVAVLRTSADGA